MKQTIKITSGTGSGSTKLSSFDAALFSAGIANYNLIHLSSIIPENFQPVKEKVNLNNIEFGHRLYVVLASDSIDVPGQEIWAGVGWVMTKGETPKGLFVEHTGSNQEEVISLIKKSLTDMISYRPESFGEIDYEVVGIKCNEKPVSAVVAAIYQSEDWKR